MSANNIKQQITQVILEIIPDITSADLQDDTDIFSLGLDSINAMTLVSNIQDVFDIQLDPNEITFENFQNIVTITAMIEQKKGLTAVFKHNTDLFEATTIQQMIPENIITHPERSLSSLLPLTEAEKLLQAPTVEELAKLSKEDAPSWSSLVPLQPHGHKPPFFCIHGQQGSVVNLRDLAHYLGSEQPFYGLQARGLDGKAPHFRIEDMAAHYIQEIRIIQPEGPYFLGGNSMGGIVAFEMAQQLYQQDQMVAALVMFDTFSRDCFPHLSFRQQHYWTYLWQLGLSKSLWREIWELLQRKQQTLLSQLYLNLGHSLSQTHSSALVAEANMQAKKAYTPKGYPGRVTLFRASEPPTFSQLYLPTPEDWSNRDPQHGWSGLASEGLEIHDIPGNHFSLFQQPHVQVLAQKLKACLNQAQMNYY